MLHTSLLPEHTASESVRVMMRPNSSFVSVRFYLDVATPVIIAFNSPHNVSHAHLQTCDVCDMGIAADGPISASHPFLQMARPSR